MNKPKLKPLAAIIAGTLLASEYSLAAVTLEEVIVEARKREESLQDVPVVVQALSGDALEANGTTTFDDLTDQVSGMTLYSQGPVQPSITIRGIQGDAINIGGDEPVSVNFDGVAHSSSQVFRYAVFDVEAVEVLKGPQALFFGKNSPGGIIVLRTKAPTDELFTELQVGYEEAAERQFAHAIVSGPINDTLGGRLAVKMQDAEGFFENQWGRGDPTRRQPSDRTGPNFDEVVAIGTLELVLDSFESTVKYYYADRDGGTYNFNQGISCENPSWNAAINPFDDCRLDNNFANAPYSALPFDPNNPLTSRYGSQDEFFSYEMEQLSWDFTWDINDTWSFNNIMGYVTQHNEAFGNLGGGGDELFTPANFPAANGPGISLGVAIDIEIEQFSEEFRFEGDFDNFSLMFGGFYDQRTVDAAQPLFVSTGVPGSPPFGGVSLPLFSDTLTKVDGNSWSVFGQLEVVLTDTVDLSIGARYTEETREMSGRGFGNGLNAAPAGPLVLAVDEVKYNNLSPELTLSWQPTGDLNLFASYKEGFKSGGFNSVPNNSVFLTIPGVDSGLDFAEEKVAGYELGFKWELLDNTLRVNGTLFTYDYTDLQQPQRRNEGGTIITETVNAGTSLTDGFELDVLWQTPIEALRLSANLAYLDSEYGEWIAECTQAQIYLDQSGCNINIDNDTSTSAIEGDPNVIPFFNQSVLDGGFEAQNREGDQLRNAPEISGSFGAMFDTQISDGLGLKTNLNAYFSGERQADARGDERAVVDPYWTFGLNVGVYSTDEAWAADLIVRNLTDEQYVVDAYTPNFAQGPAPMLAVVNNPREIALQFTFRPHVLFQ